MSEFLDKIDLLKKENKYEEMLELCRAKLEKEDNSYAHFYLGEYYYSVSKNAQALSHLLQVKENNPLYNKAQVMQEMIKSVFNFFNKDLYNP